MNKQEPWFFQERAVAFAGLVLTKHHDVRPYQATDEGVDLLVEIRAEGQSRRRLFGVQIVAAMDLPDPREADERVLARPGKDPLATAFPLCVFAIGVRKPEGIYRWLVAPVVQIGRALLHPEEEASWQTLDEAGADRLIDQVNAWYDARNR